MQIRLLERHSSDFRSRLKFLLLETELAVTRANDLRLYSHSRLVADDVSQLQPVIAVTKPRASAPQHLLDCATKHNVGLIAQEDVTDLTAYLEAEEPAASLRGEIRGLVQILPTVATTPDMAALWEAAMKKVTTGNMPLATFVEGVLRQLKDLINRGRARGPLAVPGARGARREAVAAS